MANTKKDAKSSGSGNSKTTTKPTQEKNPAQEKKPSQDEIKKRRGRPKKTPKSAGNVVNENEKQISMSASSANLVNDFNSAPNQLPQVISSTTNLAEKYTLEGIQNRWANIFGRYASMGFDTVANAWTKAWSQLNNPFVQNFRVKQIVGRSRKLKQEELQKALANPENSEYTLQEVSFWLYYSNYTYNQLIKINRDTPRYDWYVTPQYVTEKDMSSDNFREESKFVDKIMKAFDPNLTLKTIATQVNLEGKSTYLPRIGYSGKNVDFFKLQKLNYDMLKITGFGSEQQFIVSFDMMVFLRPGYDVSQYPPFIRDVWADMLGTNMIVEDSKGNLVVNPQANSYPGNGKLEWNGEYYIYWVRLPQDLAYTFYTDGAHPNAFPDTIGMFNDYNDLDDYRWLQANLLSKGVNSILTAEVPLTKDAKAGSDATIITPDTILGYTDMFMNNISGNIWPFFAPFDNFSLHTLESQPEALDIVYDRTRDLIATSGNSALLSISDKPSIASVKAAQNIQASRTDYLTRQFESFLNNIINKEFGLKYQWKISLWGDIFNKADDIKQLKELVISGVEGLFPKLLSSLGYSVEDYASSVAYTKALGIKIEKTWELEKMKEQTDLNIKSGEAIAKTNAEITQTSEESTTTETGEEKQVGRPALDDGDVENDNTQISKDSGQDTSDLKNMYSVEHCARCGKELDAMEELLCDDCLESLYEERVNELSSNTENKLKAVKDNNK